MRIFFESPSTLIFEKPCREAARRPALRPNASASRTFAVPKDLAEAIKGQPWSSRITKPVAALSFDKTEPSKFSLTNPAGGAVCHLII